MTTENTEIIPDRPQSIKGTARLLKQTPAQVRKALARGEIKTVHWAGREVDSTKRNHAAPQSAARRRHGAARSCQIRRLRKVTM